ncbi:hypothetical protein LTR78_005002 [Recurvomyces mirabilis]|uniref:Uncharacterized protein n=1 Tax=Recurvomyces mirabilis TaxID=574656 RepID=A0AAE0WNN0_9PEZI|nr:hypothetical protein LTR78_005002 [Recurvomyces mirabilis]KAK5158382.1 hypothetical protein LTS14_003400 [Recurvomyces mirabilis]
MAQTALAPSNTTTGHLQQSQSDPFPARQPSAIILRPRPPCAQTHHSAYEQQQQQSPHFMTCTNPHDSGYDIPSQHQHQSGPHKSSSVSSGGSSSLMSPMSSIDLEKKESSRHSYPRDPEKVMYKVRRDSPQQPQHHSQRSIELRGHNGSITYSEPEEDEHDAARRVQEQKAVKVLLFLSGPCVVLSALNAIWTLISVVITSLTQPVRLCAKRPTFGQQLSGLLGPALSLQLKCIYTPLPPHANDDRSYHPWTLLMVHMTSPFLSLGTMFMAWVLAVYWVSSAVVGDPAGMDKRDDGRETVLGLRGWWERYLMRCVLDE